MASGSLLRCVLGPDPRALVPERLTGLGRYARLQGWLVPAAGLAPERTSLSYQSRPNPPHPGSAASTGDSGAERRGKCQHTCNEAAKDDPHPPAQTREPVRGGPGKPTCMCKGSSANQHPRPETPEPPLSQRQNTGQAVNSGQACTRPDGSEGRAGREAPQAAELVKPAATRPCPRVPPQGEDRAGPRRPPHPQALHTWVPRTLGGWWELGGNQLFAVSRDP